MTMTRAIASSIAAAALVLFHSGCARMERPFLQVEACLVDDQGVSDFMEFVRKIADTERMRYVDRSAESQDEINRANSTQVMPIPRLLTIYLHRQDGLGIGIGNLGFPPYQISIGFSGGRDPKEARDTAERIVRMIREHWYVETVPRDEGARGIQVCDPSGIRP